MCKRVGLTAAVTQRRARCPCFLVCCRLCAPPMLGRKRVPLVPRSGARSTPTSAARLTAASRASSKTSSRTGAQPTSYSSAQHADLYSHIQLTALSDIHAWLHAPASALRCRRREEKHVPCAASPADTAWPGSQGSLQRRAPGLGAGLRASPAVRGHRGVGLRGTGQSLCLAAYREGHTQTDASNRPARARGARCPMCGPALPPGSINHPVQSITRFRAMNSAT
jgi:hypothetical protein